MENQKRFSIIIPVYNAEAYLDAAINSVIKQTLKFIDNVELILVNDGSKDHSGEICMKYMDKYPDNVIYINQENVGVSATRSRGVEVATGEIIGFLDSDDKFSVKTLAQVSNYFSIAQDVADVAVIPVTNFGAKSIPYYLNGKFKKGMRTICLDTPNWDDVCMRVGQAFVRSEAAKRVLFDSSITYFEDAKYITEIVKEKMRMGIVPECEYYYRRYPAEADSATSLTVGAESNSRLYLETPEKVSLYFLEQYNDDQDTPLYFQYMALCEMRWRMFYTSIRTRDVLSADEFVRYETINDRILNHVSDHAILTFDHYQPWQKLYLLNLKHKTNQLDELKVDDYRHIKWKEYTLGDLSKAEILLLEMGITDNKLMIKGFINAVINNSIICYARVNGKDTLFSSIDSPIGITKFPLVYDSYKYRSFTLIVPLNEDYTTISFMMDINGIPYGFPAVKFSKQGNIETVRPELQLTNGYYIHRQAASIQVYRATSSRKTVRFLKDVGHKGLRFAKRVARIILKPVVCVIRKALHCISKVFSAPVSKAKRLVKRLLGE